MASGTIVNKIKVFARQVNDCGINLKKVILFGSYAKNKQTKYSDIDVALVSDDFSGIPAEDVKLFLSALRKHYMIQAQTYNTKDFSPTQNPFVKEIIKNGVEIKFKK
jgi:predicted nucleotidyltransferase